MRKLLISFLAAFALPTAVNANVDPQVNEMCLKAADYKGCVELNTKKSSLPKCNWFRKDNCIGEIIYTNGTYRGEISDKKENGYGTLTWNDGSKHVGQYRDGKADGYGILTFSNGDKYKGQYKDNEENGFGTYTFASGSVYAGQHKDGSPNGYGTYNLINGEKFIGQHKNGRPNGLGTYYWPDGSSWEGEFKAGRKTENGFYNQSPEEKANAAKLQLQREMYENEMRLEMRKQTNDLIKSIYGNNQRIDLFMY